MFTCCFCLVDRPEFLLRVLTHLPIYRKFYFQIHKCKFVTQHSNWISRKTRLIKKKKKKQTKLSVRLGAIHLKGPVSGLCDCKCLSQSTWVWKLICLPLYSTLTLNAIKYLSDNTFSLYDCNLNGLSIFFQLQEKYHQFCWCTLQGQNDIVLSTTMLNYVSRINLLDTLSFRSLREPTWWSQSTDVSNKEKSKRKRRDSNAI